MAERAEEIAEATARHLRSVSNASPEDAGMSDAIASFTAERMLERVHLFRCHEVTELLAVLEALPAYVKKHRVRLVVVDSVAFHFRQDFRDMALRTTILAKMTQRLQQLASENALAVVTVNQVTVKPDPRGGGARLVPALGESYAHACTTRIILSWEDDTRTAYLHKSPRLPQGRARVSPGMQLQSMGALQAIQSPSTQRSKPLAQSLLHVRIPRGPMVSSASSQSTVAA